MPYICKQCENKTSFKAIHDVTQWGTEQVGIDENGDVDDSDGFNYDNSEITGVSDLECRECGCDDVEDVTLTEWNNWEGPEEELDPNERGENETWQEFMVRRSNVEQ